MGNLSKPCISINPICDAIIVGTLIKNDILIDFVTSIPLKSKYETVIPDLDIPGITEND